MDKLIYNQEEVRAKVLSGIDFLANPVKQTLSPKGGNVLYETEKGDQVLTNDGVTIAKNISSKDQIENAVIDIIKESALRTNNEAGDGTTTTILLSQVLIKEALKLIDDGYSWIEIRDELKRFGDQLIKTIEKEKTEVKGKTGLKEIATISANNDPEIADNVVKAIDVAQIEGMIFLEPQSKSGTNIEQDLGFMVKEGLLYKELLTGAGANSVTLKDVPVLLTDKKIYYEEEAETILRTAVEAGHSSVVVVARDFMGEAVNTFIANHSEGVIKVMLVKAHGVTDTDNTTLIDLATYLGGKVISEKKGSIVNKLKTEDFVVVNKAFSDQSKTLFTPKQSAGKDLKDRIKMLRKEVDGDEDNEVLKMRLASLTTGVVTIKVGGATPMEIREKLYRYEDAVNATRSAMRFGYLVGGGSSLLKAFDSLDCPNKDFLTLFRKYCEASVRQIAINCGKHDDTVVEKVKKGKKNYGYNALTDTYEDLFKAGIVDPFLVMKMAIENSISVASIIISIKNYVINDIDHDEKETDSSRN